MHPTGLCPRPNGKLPKPTILPPQLTTNTDILFVYDNSGSYSVSTGMDLVFKATTAWTETLAQSGWVGTARHTFGSYTSRLNNVYYNDDGLFTTINQLGGGYQVQTYKNIGLNMTK